MFNARSEITEIDFSNFTTSNVIDMSGMFYGCTSLDSLDLSNFDTSNVIDMGIMFYGCTSLNSLNLANFNTSNVKFMDGMFDGCSSLNLLNLSNFDTSNVEFMDGMFDGCSSLNSLDLSNFNITNYTSINYMFYNCTNLEYINLQNAYIESSILFNSLSDNVVICSSNNMIFDNTSFKNILINCIGKIIEDEDKNKCYSKKKNIYNNNICQNCGHNFYPIYNNSDININCIEAMNNHCTYYYYFNITSNIFYCTNDKNCPNDYNKLVPYRNECIINCENESIYKYEYDNICYNKKMNQSVNDMIKDFKNEFNKTDIDNGNDKKIIDKNIIMIFTSTQNQKDNENISNLTMNLGQCENILKYNYNISNNNSLYMLLLIHEEDGKKVPKVEYEIYYPLSNNNLTKLDMNYCQGTKIEISIAVKLNGDIDKYNTSSNYYNDICSKTTSSSGTDISLIDRRNEFIDNDMSLCEENCDLIDYNYDTKKSKCSCDIKYGISENINNKFDEKAFFKSFIDINNIVNINIMKCYKIVFKFEELKKNYGFLIIGSVIIMHFITLLIFLAISYDKIKKEIIRIFIALNTKEIQTQTSKKTIKQKLKKSKNKNTKSGSQSLKLKKNKIGFESKEAKYKVDNSNNKINLVLNILETMDKNNRVKNKYLEKKDFELNSINYKEAFKSDHRTLCEFYISLLKNNHPLSFSFGDYNDYNSKIIKIFLFFFSFSSDLTINALFFNDDTMHKIYQDKGQFNFIYQLPQIIYSYIISKIIDTLLKYFALSQDIIIELKEIKTLNILKDKKRKLLKIIKIKFALFFAITFLILELFLYYISCFCGIYINTQSHVIKDSLCSLVISFLLPFIIYIPPAVIRICALNVKKPNRECLYKLSSIMLII